jgi:hypothetical protein
MEIETDFGKSGVAAASATVLWFDTTLVIEDVATGNGRGNCIERGGPGNPGGVAIDQTFFFWSRTGSGHSDGYIRACKRTDCSTTSPVGDMQWRPVALAFDGVYLYWANEGQDDTTTSDTNDVIPNTGNITRAKFQSGTGTWDAPEVVVANIVRPWDMQVDDKWVYWTSYTAGTVSKVDKNGGSEIVLATGEVNPWYLAQDSTSIYWTNAILNGNVMRLAK